MANLHCPVLYLTCSGVVCYTYRCNSLHRWGACVQPGGSMISLISKITRELLNYFFVNPHEGLYVNELAIKLMLDKRNLVKKLRELEKEGILKSQKRGNLKLYSADKNYPLYEEYRNIILKTFGFEDKLKQIIHKTKGVKIAFIYGSYAANKMEAYSDIDLLVVGNHDIILLQKMISKLQKEIDREINVVNMDSSDYENRLKKKDPFVMSIMKRKHIKLL